MQTTSPDIPRSSLGPGSSRTVSPGSAPCKFRPAIKQSPLPSSSRANPNPLDSDISRPSMVLSAAIAKAPFFRRSRRPPRSSFESCSRKPIRSLLLTRRTCISASADCSFSESACRIGCSQLTRRPAGCRERTGVPLFPFFFCFIPLFFPFAPLRSRFLLQKGPAHVEQGL